MKIKKKALALAVAGALSFGIGANDVGFQAPIAQYAEAAVAKTVGASSANAGALLIADKTGVVFTKNEAQALSDEQARIHQKGEVAVKYDFYTYVYDSETKAKDEAKKVADEYAKHGESVPFVFVLNKHDGSYHFIEDTKLAPYTSAAYLSTLAEKTFANGVDANSVKEFVIRADSTIMMSVDGDFAFTGQMPINEQASREHVDIQNFSDTANVGKHADQQNKTDGEDTKKADEESSGMIPAAIAFVLAVGTILFFKKRKGR